MNLLVKYGMHECIPLEMPGSAKKMSRMHPEECFLDD